MIIGEKSLEVNKEKLRKAKNMFNDNINVIDIYKETDFFLGADRKWRTFISDKHSGINDLIIEDVKRKSNLDEFIVLDFVEKMEDDKYLITSVDDNISKVFSKDEILDSFNKDDAKKILNTTNKTEMFIIIPLEKFLEYKLKDFFINSKLYELYPELNEIKIQFTKKDEKISGTIDTVNKIIKLNINSQEFIEDNFIEIKKTMVHEIQHFIQKIEGFYNGSSCELERLRFKFLELSNDDLNILEKELENKNKSTLTFLESKNILNKFNQRENEELIKSLMLNTVEQLKNNIILKKENKTIENDIFNNYYTSYGEIESRFTEKTMNHEKISFPLYSLSLAVFNYNNNNYILEEEKFSGVEDWLDFIRKISNHNFTMKSLENNKEKIEFDEINGTLKLYNMQNFHNDVDIITKISKEIFIKKVIPEGLSFILGEKYKENIDKIYKIIDKDDNDFKLLKKEKLEKNELVEKYLAIKLDKQRPSEREISFIKKVGIFFKATIKKIFMLDFEEKEVLDIMNLTLSKKTISEFLLSKISSVKLKTSRKLSTI